MEKWHRLQHHWTFNGQNNQNVKGNGILRPWGRRLRTSQWIPTTLSKMIRKR